jgi:hypothetical protein
MLSEGLDCAFGSRFVKGGCVVDYPPVKDIISATRRWSR